MLNANNKMQLTILLQLPGGEKAYNLFLMSKAVHLCYFDTNVRSHLS